jgi:uncharacterized protein YoxC
LVTAFYIIASVAIIVITVMVVAVGRSMMSEMRKVGQATDQLNGVLQRVNEEILPLAQNASKTISDMDVLVVNATGTAERINRLAASVESLLDTSNVATTATKVAKSTAAELISVYEGVKRGIKTLRGS